MRSNMMLGEIEAFVAIAEHNSFRKAAEELSLSPPALSRRLSKLEQALGIKLVERTTRSVSLTALGREFHRRALELLDDLESSLLVLRDVETRRSTIFTVACVPTATQYFLPPVVKLFGELHPRARVRVLDLAANEVLAAVLNGEAELGITFTGNSEPGIAFKHLLQDPFVLACHRDHPLAQRSQVRWRELENYPLVAVSKGSGNRLLIDTRLAEAGLQLPWTYEVRHMTTSLGLVERGLGVAALPRTSLPEVGHPILASVPLIEPFISRTIAAIHRQNARLSLAAQGFYDLLLKQLPGNG
jgi:Transcriptional regulator